MKYLFRLSLHTSLSWISVNELVDHFYSKITNVIDATAPTKVKVVSGKERSPWRNATLVRIEKRQKQISRFVMTSINRDFTFIIWN